MRKYKIASLLVIIALGITSCGNKAEMPTEVVHETPSIENRSTEGIEEEIPNEEQVETLIAEDIKESSKKEEPEMDDLIKEDPKEEDIKKEENSRASNPSVPDKPKVEKPNENKPSVPKPSVPMDTITTKTLSEERAIEFQVIKENDSSMSKGEEKVTRSGVTGVEKITYTITYTNGKETNRVVTKSAVNQIVKVGTKEVQLAGVEFLSGAEQEIFRLVNIHRVNNGLNELAWDNNLAKASRYKSKEMIEENYFSHSAADGSNENSVFGTLHSKFGVGYNRSAENIAATMGSGKASGEKLFIGWKNSPGHNANMLNSDMTHIGVGVAYSPKGGSEFGNRTVTTGTQHFGGN